MWKLHGKNMTIYFLIGIVGTLLVTFAGIPQIIKTIKIKHSKGLSLIFFLQVEIGLVLTTIYSFHIKDFVFILSNCISFIVNTLIILSILKYRTKT